MTYSWGPTVCSTWAASTEPIWRAPLVAQPAGEADEEAGPERVADPGGVDPLDVAGDRHVDGSWPLVRMSAPSLPRVMTRVVTRSSISAWLHPVLAR